VLVPEVDSPEKKKDLFTVDLSRLRVIGGPRESAFLEPLHPQAETVPIAG
jgi:hypothetical protein